ncbi:TPA: cell division protein FtsZ [Vibrio parahaemolyticus]
MFELEKSLHSIALIGIGCCGHNAVNYVKESLDDGVDLFILDTDARGLTITDHVHKIAIGAKVTGGRSAGAVPEVGKQAMQESINEVLSHLTLYDLIFIVGGLGGGTATGAIPVLAKSLHKLDVITVYVLTTPFDFEGKKKKHYAELALTLISEFGDSTLMVSNQKMFETLPKKSLLTQAFNTANDVLKQSVLGIFSLIKNTGNINLDYADLSSILKSSGHAVIGLGYGEGDRRIEDALKQALHPPLLDEFNLSTAKGGLVNIRANTNMQLSEIYLAGEFIHEYISSEIPIIWGTEIIE